MDQQNIDRLFREKLGHLEATPAESSWSAVEKSIVRKKNKALYYAVAASLALLCICSFVLYKTMQDNVHKGASVMASAIDHPVYLPKSTPIFHPVEQPASQIMKEYNVVETAHNLNKKPVKSRVLASYTMAAETEHLPTKEENEEATQVAESAEETTVDEQAVALVPTQDIKNEETKKAQVVRPEKATDVKVKITYIASNSASIKVNEELPSNGGDVEKSKSLKKLIAKAEQIDPAEVLYNFKSAKENLLRTGLSSKKDRSIP